MSDKFCMRQEAGVLIFPCSGGSDVGELSDRVGPGADRPRCFAWPAWVRMCRG